MMAARKGAIVPEKSIIFRNELGPYREGRRAAATTDMETGEITFYAHSISDKNYWISSSIMDHELSHWMDYRFSISNYGYEEIDEIRAYTRQIQSPDFVKTPTYYQTGAVRLLNGYLNKYNRQAYPCTSMDMC